MTVPPLCRGACSCIHPMIPSWSLVPGADSGVHTDCCAFSLERPGTIRCPRVTSTTRERDAGSSDRDPRALEEGGEEPSSGGAGRPPPNPLRGFGGRRARSWGDPSMQRDR